tara:strand:- start:278 stop:628 length:351 start_codon:yes stop_codon:yes gene_type:complete
MNFIRSIVLALVSWTCLFSSFKGYPLAFISCLGFIVIFAAWTTGVTAIFHPMGRGLKARVGYVFVAILLAVLGDSMLYWGGIVNLKFFDSMIHLKVLGSAIGFLSGIFNLDKNMAQ